MQQRIIIKKQSQLFITNQQSFYKMSIRGSRVTSPSKIPITSNQPTYVPIDSTLPSMNGQSQMYTSYSLPSKAVYTGINANTYQQSRFTTDQVSKITGSKFNNGQVVKGICSNNPGQSRIQYVPYEKKVIDYETRTYTEMVPKTRKVVEYQERKIIETVPREVIKQDYYAVEKITQYYKQFIPEKTIEIVPKQKKVKRVEYVPVEKQIVHYPQNENWTSVQGQSRAVLESQGVQVRQDAEFRPIQSDLLYKYVNTQTNSPNLPVGYVDLGHRRYLSTAPTFVEGSLTGSNVQSMNPNYISYNETYSYKEPLNFYQSQATYGDNYLTEQPTFINRVNEDNFNNVIAGNKYEYRYGNPPDYPQTKYY